MTKDSFRRQLTILLSFIFVLSHWPIQVCASTQTLDVRLARINALLSELKTYDNLLRILSVEASDLDRQFLNMLRHRIGSSAELPKLVKAEGNSFSIPSSDLKVKVYSDKDGLFISRGETINFKKNESLRRKTLLIKDKWTANLKTSQWPIFNFNYENAAYAQSATKTKPSAKRGVKEVVGTRQKRDISKPKATRPLNDADESARILTESPGEDMNLVDIGFMNIPKDQFDKMFKPAVVALVVGILLTLGLKKSLLAALLAYPALLTVFMLSDRAYGSSIKAIPKSPLCPTNIKKGQPFTIEYRGSSKPVVIENDVDRPDRKEIYELCTSSKRSSERRKIEQLFVELSRKWK